MYDSYPTPKLLARKIRPIGPLLAGRGELADLTADGNADIGTSLGPPIPCRRRMQIATPGFLW
jgi:hypothetical protein